MADVHLDKIHIRDLTVRCIVGINPEERVNRQDVVINVTLWADYRTACASDDIDDTVDYKTIKNKIFTMVEASNYGLIEAMAQQIADLCFESPAVMRVQVCVDKPAALRFARSVAVEIDRARSDGQG